MSLLWGEHPDARHASRADEARSAAQVPQSPVLPYIGWLNFRGTGSLSSKHAEATLCIQFPGLLCLYVRRLSGRMSDFY